MKKRTIESEAEIRSCCEILQIALDISKLILLLSYDKKYDKEPMHEPPSKDILVNAYDIFFKLLISLSKPQQSE